MRSTIGIGKLNVIGTKLTEAVPAVFQDGAEEKKRLRIQVGGLRRSDVGEEGRLWMFLSYGVEAKA